MSYRILLSSPFTLRFDLVVVVVFLVPSSSPIGADRIFPSIYPCCADLFLPPPTASTLKLRKGETHT